MRLLMSDLRWGLGGFMMPQLPRQNGGCPLMRQSGFHALVIGPQSNSRSLSPVISIQRGFSCLALFGCSTLKGTINTLSLGEHMNRGDSTMATIKPSQEIDHGRRHFVGVVATSIAAAGATGWFCASTAAAAEGDAIRPFRVNVPEDQVAEC